MAEDGGCSIDIIERSQISLPPNSVPNSLIPLSFFDIPWLLCRPMQRLIFYDLPQYSLFRFTETAIPSLKRSLSVALQRFFPLAGGLACPPPPGKPHIIYSNGDSVPFTAAVSAGDFDELTSDHPQAAPLVHHLLPPLPPQVVKDGTLAAPLLAVQVSLFPNSGICVGVQFIHVAADGMAFHHFMKTWASICREALGGDAIGIEKSVPVVDRSVVKDLKGLEPILLKEWFSTWKDNILSPSPSPSPSPYVDKLRSTFTLSRSRIDRLKSWILSRIEGLLHVSAFVATCAFIWPILIRSREIGKTKVSNSDVNHFCFLVDCRGRLGYPIPEKYFGNCLGICFVALKREELVGRQGMVAAARVIGARVKDLEMEGGPLKAAERWLLDWAEVSGSGSLVVVAGSTRLRVYETDFGWGRPRKSLVVHVDRSEETISITESREEEGGVEVGLALGKASMDAFRVMFEQSLSSFCG